MKQENSPEENDISARSVLLQTAAKPGNALSFDLEDWYQVLYFEGHISRDEWFTQESRLQAITSKLLDILDAHKTRATFFVLGWNAERMPHLIEEIHSRGHEIASHGFAHQLIYRQSPEAFAHDLSRSLLILRSITGQPVKGYRAPSFSITRESAWAFSILMDHGVEYDSSVLPARRPYCGIPDAPRGPWLLCRNDGRRLTELPPSTFSMLGRNFPFSGGGYFRLLPYWVVHWGLCLTNRAGLPGVVYLHPWELDPGHPVLQIRWSHRFQHYVNLRHTERKLKRLLTDFQFVPMAEIHASVQATEVVKINGANNMQDSRDM